MPGNRLFSHCLHSGPLCQSPSGMSTFKDFDSDANANGDFNLLFKSIACAVVINGQCQTGSTFASTSTSGPYEEVSQKSSSVPDESSITSVTTPDNPSAPIPSATTGSPATSADPPTSFSSAIPSLPPSTSSGVSPYSTEEPSASVLEPTPTSSIPSPPGSAAQSGLVHQSSPNATVTGSHSSSTNASQTLSPSPVILTTGSVVTQDGPASISPASTVAVASSSDKHSSHTGAIIGGVIGGLAFLLLATAAAILLYRRMRARRTAPSAEFMDIMRGTTPGPVPASGAMRAEGTATPSGDHLLGLEDDGDERPPAFIPGTYGDPVLEKVQAAAAMRQEYQRRGSYAAAQADYKEGLRDSEVGHDDESTDVGTEEDYGYEKAGYTWAM
ncbi:hypothetical protein VTO73DRAFT_13427 [Trametes versicolor]